MIFRFGDFTADRTAYRVLRGRVPLDLTPKLLDLLFYFLDRPAQLVTRDALLDAVWPDANVTDNALAQAISDLREALGDSAASPTYIMTVARRGYRFIAPVVAPGDAAAPATADAERPAAGGHSPAVAAPAPSALRAPAAEGDRPAIAVLDFENVTGADAVGWLAAGIAETVTSDLTALGHFRVIDRWRVVQAVRQTGGGLHDVGTALGAAFLVTGSYQRSGARLRITSRIVDAAGNSAGADAKLDGPAEDIFALQDGIVPALARALRLPGAAPLQRPAARETSNLEAYRAYTEGWLKIESLDTDQVPAAIADFERAIALDGRYALAYAGLATAEIAAYEMTRLVPQPNQRALASGIEHARHAIRLDDELADAHATLAFLLVSARQIAEGRAAGRRAVALEPDNWRHHYRLGHALWGGERLDTFERALAIYPDFAYALLEMAMVHVARAHLDGAEAIAREGIAVQDRQSRAGDRFPAVGFHWLLGSLLAARGDDDAAAAEFECELAGYDRRRLYGPEYAAAAWVGRGQADLSRRRPADAVRAFERAFDYIPAYGRASIGLAAAFDRLGDRARATAARRDVDAAIVTLRQTQRPYDALLLEASAAAMAGEVDRAVAKLSELLDIEPPSFLGWTIPIEPFLNPLRDRNRLAPLLARLAARAE
jgi:DNA-binding winged helix-turn-helix (wHTH) protein/Tfp pilus assembly protein PilF